MPHSSGEHLVNAAFIASRRAKNPAPIALGVRFSPFSARFTPYAVPKRAGSRGQADGGRDSGGERAAARANTLAAMVGEHLGESGGSATVGDWLVPRATGP